MRKRVAFNGREFVGNVEFGQKKTVLDLLEVSPQGSCYHVFADSFFCSIGLRKLQEQNNIKASETLRQNRFVKTYRIVKKSNLKNKNGLGHCEQKTADDESASVTAWKDNKVVFF